MPKPKKCWKDKPLNHHAEIEWNSKSGKTIKYKAVVGQIELDAPFPDKLGPKSNPKGCARMGYTAYFHPKPKKERPLAFCFNGGPGSASLWLHLGAFGPMVADRLSVEDIEKNNKSALVDNPDSLLHKFDLVFVDPIGTGFSEASSEEIKANFFTEFADANSIASFVERFLTEMDLWLRPVYLIGESYGGFRAALVADRLIGSHGIFPAGLGMVAPYLSSASIEESQEQIVARTNFYISYVVSAWFHKKSSLTKTSKTAADAYQVAKSFINAEVIPALLSGGIRTLAKPKLTKFASMMGMPVEQLKKVGDSFCISDFAENLFHDQPKYPGRLDSRVCLSQPLVLGANTYIDPALLALDGRMTKLTNALFRDVLGLKTKKKYKSFGLDIGRKWRYEGARSSIAELSGAMKKNPGMKLYCCSGYFDLAVTVRGIEQDLSLLNLTKELQGNIVHESFPAGHMMYSEPDIRKTITKSIVKSFDV